MLKRRKAERSHQNHERWLITYADLITLLMIFFVILYAMSKVDIAKFQTLSISLARALHQQNTIPLDNPDKNGLVFTTPGQDGHQASNNGQLDSSQVHDKQLDNLYAQVKAYIDQHHLSGNVSIENQPRGVQITLRDVVLFDTGQAVIKPDAEGILSGLVPFFQTLNNPIVIEGYTDDRPISTPQFPSNWELSAARAINVVRFLAGQHVDPTRLSGVGYGEYHPIVPNDSEEHRQMNRRINIVILREPPLNYVDQNH